ncbi:MAG: hypothetical protein Q4B14_03090 [Clostridia bacterium]|nr:hypothetical protein [Clostridia bacterium]
MKKNVKNFSLILSLVLLFGLMVGCSNSGGNNDSPLIGKYNSVAGEMEGIVLTGDDIAGFSIELKANSQATVSIDSEVIPGTWTESENTVKIIASAEGEEAEMIGTVGENTLIFENMFETGLKVTFAKEGTDAEKPENYFTEADKKSLGQWKSTAVKDALGEDISSEIAADAFTANITSDHKMVVTLSGQEVAKGTWTVFSNSGYLTVDGADAGSEVEGPSIYWDIVDGVDTLDFIYSNGDQYYVFTCGKQ